MLLGVMPEHSVGFLGLAGGRQPAGDRQTRDASALGRKLATRGS
jgi:hypothetical protein